MARSTDIRYLDPGFEYIPARWQSLKLSTREVLKQSSLGATIGTPGRWTWRRTVTGNPIRQWHEWRMR